MQSIRASWIELVLVYFLQKINQRALCAERVREEMSCDARGEM